MDDKNQEKLNKLKNGAVKVGPVAGVISVVAIAVITLVRVFKK